MRPSVACSATTAPSPSRARCAASASSPRRVRPHDQVLRNQSVGSTCSGAASGPRLATVIRIRMSSGDGLGVLDDDVEVAVVVEDAGVEQLELAARAVPRRRFSSTQPRVGELAPAGTCRAPSCTSASAWSRGRSSTPSRPRRGCPRARSGRTGAPSGSDRAPFHSASAKQSRHSRSHDAEQAVLAPAVGAAARVVVREVVPAVAVGRVVLAHRAPLPLGEVRPPALPVAARCVLLEPPRSASRPGCGRSCRCARAGRLTRRGRRPRAADRDRRRR